MCKSSVERITRRAVCGFLVVSMMIFAASTEPTYGQRRPPAPQVGGLGVSDGKGLANAHLSGILKGRIEHDLGWQDMTADDRSETEHASTVYHLIFPAWKGRPARRVVRVSGGGPECGRGGNCPALLYDEATGARLFRSDGYNLVFLSTNHGGAPDLEIDDSTAPATLFHSVYSFDGAVYRQRRRWKYCCGD